MRMEYDKDGGFTKSAHSTAPQLLRCARVRFLDSRLCSSVGGDGWSGSCILTSTHCTLLNRNKCWEGRVSSAEPQLGPHYNHWNSRQS
jgi:hypothetical protein